MSNDASDTKPGAIPVPAANGQQRNEAAMEAARVARARLLEVEVLLRDVWYEAIDITPVLAARVNVAVRHVRQAAEALGSETLL